jgi:hypothetical protein
MAYTVSICCSQKRTALTLLVDRFGTWWNSNYIRLLDVVSLPSGEAAFLADGRSYN